MSIEQKLKAILGELVFNNTAQAQMIEELQAKIANIAKPDNTDPRAVGPLAQAVIDEADRSKT